MRRAPSCGELNRWHSRPVGRVFLSTPVTRHLQFMRGRACITREDFKTNPVLASVCVIQPGVDILDLFRSGYPLSPLHTHHAGVPSPVATPTGLEPALFGVTGRRDTLLHHGAISTRRKRKFIRNRTALFVLQTNVQPMNLKYSSKEILLCAPLVRKVGLEPTHHYWQRLLRPPCLPFHHSRIYSGEKCLTRYFANLFL